MALPVLTTSVLQKADGLTCKLEELSSEQKVAELTSELEERSSQLEEMTHRYHSTQEEVDQLKVCAEGMFIGSYGTEAVRIPPGGGGCGREGRREGEKGRRTIIAILIVVTVTIKLQVSIILLNIGCPQWYMYV